MVGYDGDGYHCNIVQCPSPRNIANGRKTGRSSTYGSIVHFSCHRGYRLVGVQSVACLADGRWNDTMPRCTGLNKHVNHQVLLIVDYWCLLVSDVDECKEKLSGCDSRRGTCHNSNGAYSCGCVAGYQLDGKRCDPRPCRSLKHPRHGTMVGNIFVFGANVSFDCNPGYELHGIRSLTCQANGKWNGKKPACRRMLCYDI